MRHQKGNKKLSLPTDQRMAMLKSMSVSLFKHDRIEITEIRAKELKKFSDRIVTLIKKGDLNSRRKVTALLLHDNKLVGDLFKNVDRFKSRNGGYSRIIKTSVRRGDATQMALIELVDATVSAA